MKKILYAAVSVLVFLAAAGCARYGALEDDYGKSYNRAKYGQILNPEAHKNLKPVVGLSGEASQAAMQKYTDSFSNGGEQSAKQGSTPKSACPSGTGTDTHGK